jgi:hypothetical protein
MLPHRLECQNSISAKVKAGEAREIERSPLGRLNQIPSPDKRGTDLLQYPRGQFIPGLPVYRPKLANTPADFCLHKKQIVLCRIQGVLRRFLQDGAKQEDHERLVVERRRALLVFPSATKAQLQEDPDQEPQW